MNLSILHFCLSLCITLLSQIVTAQNFNGVPQFYPIAAVQNSSAAFADINGDNYIDLLISGLGRYNDPMTKLYINDGLGNFLEKPNTPFVDVHYSGMAIADLNGDGFSDVVLTGNNKSSTLPIKLYINDGQGNFSEIDGLPPLKIWKATVVLEDLNGDIYPDVIVSGRTGFSTPTTRLYINNGSAHFTEVKETPIIDVYDSSIAIKDVNGDKHADILISGLIRAKEPITKLYINDGKGGFSETADSLFTGVSDGSVSLEDMDKDGYPEVLISGKSSSFFVVTKLYMNDGQGQFTEMQEQPFYKEFMNSMAIIDDLDNNGYPDVLIAGRKSSGAQFTKLYMNDSLGNFTEKKNHLDGIINGAIAIADVNNDDDHDILITGRTKSGDPMTNLYTNDGTGAFSKKQETITGVYGGHMAIADINGDQHPDFFIAGRSNSLKEVMKLYVNDGVGNFKKVRKTLFNGTVHSLSMADVNGDKFPDVLVTGWDYGGVTKLFLNDGTGSFFEMQDTLFEGVSHGSGMLVDLNGDQHLDVLISGNDGDIPVTKLYLNDGVANFSEKAGTYFTGVESSSMAVADVNGDDYPDVFISGWDKDGNGVTELYTNDSLGQFTKVRNTPFISGPGSIVVSDIDGDDFPDVLIAGSEDGYSAIKLYTNKGHGQFTEVENTPFEGWHDLSIALVDINDNNLPDIIVSGNDGATPILKLYKNEGNNHFTEISETPFSPLLGSAIIVDDINGDGRSDVLIAGENSSLRVVTKLYLNEGG